MSKKRGREVSNVNTALIEIYEDLAHEDEEVRIKAAHKLLTVHVLAANTDELRVILKRLIRGLCSSRKAARLGFSTALTECLVAVGKQGNGITASEVLDILESATVPEGGTHGQEERDHHFGRLFGCDAIIQSGFLAGESQFSQWQRLLDIICELAIKKPWLRRECGWILFKQISAEHAQMSLSSCSEVLKKLDQHKLIRTPEGLALWIKARSQSPTVQLPKNVWKHGDPLARQDLHALAQILKDSKANSKDDDDFAAQGSAMWTSQLHYVWDVVLTELFKSVEDTKRVNFKEFWKVAVDEGLMAAGSSQERKHWGLLLLQKAVRVAPIDLLDCCLSPNIVSCLLQSAKTKDRYTQKGTELSLRALQKRAEQGGPDAAQVVRTLLRSLKYIDVDIATKSKTIEKIGGIDDVAIQIAVMQTLHQLFLDPDTTDDDEVAARRRVLIGIQSRQLSRIVSQQAETKTESGLQSVASILQGWMINFHDGTSGASKHNLSSTSKDLLQEKLGSAFGEVLKIGREGQSIVLDCVDQLENHDLSADAEILEIIRKAWARFSSHRKQSAKTSKAGSTNEYINGLTLLYGLVIFQAYTDEPDAVSILEELLAYEKRNSGSGSKIPNHNPSGNADDLVEIVLSFASRPSKFMRRVTIEIFESFTSQITKHGLAPLIDVLSTQETKAGQSELFEADEGTDISGSDTDHGSDSDVEMLDSDVELISADGEAESEDDSNSGTESQPSSDADSDSEASEDDSAELEALEKAIANTLGTRKLKPADIPNSGSTSSSDSDSDMTDSEMLALDNKLADVFKARAATVSASQQKKKENKSAKENITNFKNRVLDLIDIFIRKEYLRPVSLDLVLPLLRLSRESSVQQMRQRATDLVKTLCSKCKGLGNVPILRVQTSSGGNVKSKDGPQGVIAASDEVQSALATLMGIHEEVSLASPNIHKSACSQASILMVKVLLKAGISVEECVNIYAKTQTRMLMDTHSTVQPQFFIEWVNWCREVRGKLGSDKAGQQPNGNVKSKKSKKAKSQTKSKTNA